MALCHGPDKYKKNLLAHRSPTHRSQRTPSTRCIATLKCSVFHCGCLYMHYPHRLMPSDSALTRKWQWILPPLGALLLHWCISTDRSMGLLQRDSEELRLMPETLKSWVLSIQSCFTRLDSVLFLSVLCVSRMIVDLWGHASLGLIISSYTGLYNRSNTELHLKRIGESWLTHRENEHKAESEGV